MCRRFLLESIKEALNKLMGVNKRGKRKTERGTFRGSQTEKKYIYCSTKNGEWSEKMAAFMSAGKQQFTSQKK